LKKLLIPLFWFIVAAALLSCGGKGSGSKTSGIAYRAFVSNAVGNAGIFIVNAADDVHPQTVNPIQAGESPTLMMVTPDRTATLVFSPGLNQQFPDNEFTIISNASESNSAHVVLPGYTESFVISPDSSTAYAAVPNAPLVGQSPGAIEVVGVAGSVQGTITGEIDIPSVHYLSINNGGDRILAFSSNSDSVAVVTPANLGTSFPVVSYVAGFDHPVQAFFSSDDTTAYVVNCGAECGGTQASVQTLDMTTNPPTPGTSPVVCTSGRCLGLMNVAAGSEALVNGSTMYLAGTPYSAPPNSSPSFTCEGAAGEVLNCGTLSVVDLSHLAVTASGIAITDGYHNRIAMGANGQLFIGATTCTEISSATETRGCLSIYNTQTTANGNVPAGGVVIPSVNGDVTGIQPIATRSVVYLVQGYATPGGSLYIYCTNVNDGASCYTADALQTAPDNEPTYAPLMTGNFYGVVTVDF
jgi:hypothetical protein